MRAALILLLLTTRVAWAQLPDPAQAQPEAPVPGDDDAVTPSRVDTASCLPLDVTPGALLTGTRTGPSLATPIPWTEFAIVGRLVEPKETVHKLLEPTLSHYRTSLSAATLPQVAQVVARFGYQLVDFRTEDLPNGTRLVLELAPLPLVRKVEVNVDRSYWGITSIADKQLDDDVRQRMGIRTGSYLPWEPIRRQCALLDERRRIEEYLHDEGYFDATVTIIPVMELARASLRVKIQLATPYTVGKITISCPAGSQRDKRGRCVDPTKNTVEELAIREDDIKDQFKHTKFCLLKVCVGTAPFTRTQHQSDLQALRERFQRAGYPSVRIVSSDPSTTLDRRTKTVNPIITIDQRRKVQIEFEGHDRDAISDGDLRKQLTFDAAGSADDVEVANSARDLTTFLQTKGYFDALVTATRDRIDVEPRPNSSDPGVHFDRITFHLAPGRQRRVTSVEFVGNTSVMKDDELAKLVATKVANAGNPLFGTSASATSAELITDQDRIKEAYRRAGYPNAQVYPSASITKAGLDNAALTAALLGTDDSNALYVRFTIDEGKPTLLSRVVIVGANDKPIDDELCAMLLSELAGELKQPEVAVRAKEPGCTARANTLAYRVDDVATTRDGLREFLFKNGRTRAQVELTAVPFGVDRVEARYTIKSAEPLRIGKVILRGNFRTKEKVILGELQLEEGAPLTSDALADGARRLRNTGLFDAVNIDLPELDCEGQQRTCDSEVVNAIVRIEERFDYLADISLEFGLSSFNGLFGTFRLGQRNLLGRGLRFLASTTLGTKLQEVEGAFRIPSYLVGHWFTTDLTGTYREQDTPRFGILTTKGFSVGLTRQFADWRNHPLTIGAHYDFRLRSRNVDALRPIGADMDESQVAISTRTGAIGVTIELEHRIDRTGKLNPLSPEGGYRLEASVSYASPYLLGQDTFMKVSGSASKFFLVGDNLMIRLDGRYDQGIPLSGAVLLPEVERFFAGGDPTVRGYSDDRLATELVQVGVPPLDNITQIRVIPAGGNIRVLGSVDAQLRIWKIFAGAMFADAGLITNSWKTVDIERSWDVIPTDIAAVRPSVGMGLRALTPFGVAALEYAVPLRPRLGDDPRGRIHFYFAARAQF